MQLNLDESDALQSEFGVNKFTTVAVTRKRQAIILSVRLESWKARLFFAPHSAKESLERLINSAEYTLSRLRVDNTRISVSANLRQLLGLCVIIERNAIDAPSVSTLLQGSVVQPARFRELKGQCFNLCASWIKTILVSYSNFSHARRVRFSLSLVRLRQSLQRLSEPFCIIPQLNPNRNSFISEWQIFFVQVIRLAHP